MPHIIKIQVSRTGITGEGGYLERMSFQHLTLESSFPSKTVSSQCLTLGWLCCIASYDGLKIKKIANISSLLFWYL
ncbi:MULTISPECIES: hypothetical protein [unclassified Wolbachia]|uniref:hypothetical protein n=1 Tax=unclassified Wolbachia TaxID=2640676 RepID=UPI002226E5D6|nr:hypothetical protein [Wolbachia endosymbiont (group A) of Sphecodes monilicornis]